MIFADTDVVLVCELGSISLLLLVAHMADMSLPFRYDAIETGSPE